MLRNKLYYLRGKEKMLDKLLRSATQVFSLEELPTHNGEVEERYLTDQQRIIRLLSENDGKMWQGGLIDETGWSASKVSRALSEMETEGRIIRYQFGREKLVTVPESTAVGHGYSSAQPATSD